MLTATMTRGTFVNICRQTGLLWLCSYGQEPGGPRLPWLYLTDIAKCSSAKHLVTLPPPHPTDQSQCLLQKSFYSRVKGQWTSARGVIEGTGRSMSLTLRGEPVTTGGKEGGRDGQRCVRFKQAHDKYMLLAM